MMALSWKALLLSVLVSQSLAASSASQTSTSVSKPSTTVSKSSTTVKASLTSKSTASKTAAGTSCAYEPSPLATTPQGPVCDGRGTLTKPAEVERLCYDYYRYSYQGQPDCYHSCSRDSRCVSFGWDAYNQKCHLYSKPIASMGLVKNETSLFVWDLHGCYTCDQPALPVKSACPPLQTDVPAAQQAKNQCGVTGVVADDNPVAVFDSYVTTFTGCYQSCVDYDRSGLCETFSYGSPSFKEVECRIYKKSLKQLGFTPTSNATASFYSLRGCYNCTLPANETREDCDTADLPINPHMSNADFQTLEYNDYLNRTQPADWSVNYDPGLYSARQKGSNLVGAMTNPGPYNQFLGSLFDFDFNPYSGNRFYNVTFDWALPKYQLADEKMGGNCTMFVGPTNDPGLRLRRSMVGTGLKKRGPFLMDASGNGVPGYITLYVQCNNDQAAGDNVTVWFDNVQWTQHGKVVAGVGAKN